MLICACEHEWERDLFVSEQKKERKWNRKKNTPNRNWNAWKVFSSGFCVCLNVLLSQRNNQRKMVVCCVTLIKIDGRVCPFTQSLIHRSARIALSFASLEFDGVCIHLHPLLCLNKVRVQLDTRSTTIRMSKLAVK